MDYDLKKYHLILEEPLDITPISYCTNLTELKLLSLNIKYIEPIKNLIKLENLYLADIGSKIYLY